MRNEPWVWPEVRDAGTSGAGAVPLRSAQMMGQKKKKKKNHLVCFLLEFRYLSHYKSDTERALINFPVC